MSDSALARFDPLIGSIGLLSLAALTAAILIVYAMRRQAPRAAPSVLRVLALAGLIVPAWNVLRWYRDFAPARAWAVRMQIDTDGIVEQIVVNSVAFLSLGFLVLIGGIYLARRAERTE